MFVSNLFISIYYFIGTTILAVFGIAFIIFTAMVIYYVIKENIEENVKKKNKNKDQKKGKSGNCQ